MNKYEPQIYNKHKKFSEHQLGFALQFSESMNSCLDKYSQLLKSICSTPDMFENDPFKSLQSTTLTQCTVTLSQGYSSVATFYKGM